MNRKASRRVIARTIAARILEQPAKQSHWLRVLAAYLIDNRMTDDADLVVNDIAHELYVQSGHLLVDVTSARALTDSVRDELTRTMREATGATHIELAEHTDPALLGGLVARTPDAVLDVSVSAKLKQLAIMR